MEKRRLNFKYNCGLEVKEFSLWVTVTKAELYISKKYPTISTSTHRMLNELSFSDYEDEIDLTPYTPAHSRDFDEIFTMWSIPKTVRKYGKQEGDKFVVEIPYVYAYSSIDRYVNELYENLNTNEEIRKLHLLGNYVMHRRYSKTSTNKKMVRYEGEDGYDIVYEMTKEDDDFWRMWSTITRDEDFVKLASKS